MLISLMPSDDAIVEITFRKKKDIFNYSNESRFVVAICHWFRFTVIGLEF
jgi:hypothetical protein